MKVKNALEVLFAAALSSACALPVNNLETTCPTGNHLAQSELRPNIAVDLMIGGGRQNVVACLSDAYTTPDELETQCVQGHEELVISKETGVHTWDCLPEDHK
jgi:hypothetical protein